MKLRLKHKLIGIVALAALVPVAVMSFLIFREKRGLDAQLTGEMDGLIRENTRQIAIDVHEFCEAMHELLLQQVDHNLNVAEEILRRDGGVRLDSQSVPWKAVNQFNSIAVDARLPKLLLGGKWLGQNRDAAVRTSLVDEVTGLVGGTCTVFQRLNERGDMIRVATTVLSRDGTRAIGTYIPAVEPDGKTNPVIAAVLRGESYRGRAFVVNAWYLTRYQPLTDIRGRLIGMLYVGIKQESVESLRHAILQIKVGKSGYVWVLNGSGAERGRYIISRDGKRDGEDLWEQRDADGRYFIQAMVNKALTLKPDEVAFERYPWKDANAAAPRMKIAAIFARSSTGSTKPWTR